MFQYAFGKYLSELYGVGLKIDLTLMGLESSVQHTPTRSLDLDSFQMKFVSATPDEIKGFFGREGGGLRSKLKNRMSRLFGGLPVFIQDFHRWSLDEVVALGQPIAIVGRWQSEGYFKAIKEQVKLDFNLNNIRPTEVSEKVEADMLNHISVAVHVRRGDYLLHPEYSMKIGALDESYYRNAMAHLEGLLPVENIKYYFVSEDIEWCKGRFSDLERVEFVTQEHSKAGYFADMRLLSKAQHCIISNSTFAWWGAYLGSDMDDRIIVAPSRWAIDPHYCPPDIIPGHWISIDNEFENNTA